MTVDTNTMIFITETNRKLEMRGYYYYNKLAREARQRLFRKLR